ncbi:SDR family oxidoreductase [Nocardioides baculatus]|uniref:SDR family oxidoreductase n=1 Tax=Nocardioides baculatus TaxID=2801337 RepID=A0ABS1L4G5_9ACTN|nr:SDR family oxidoreductase [Nocardioides baculatus]MBL0746323.1 SDR family oxidoreductase [Nocardioides baculatus]
MIIVTGATGALNGATVDHLLQHVPPSEIVVVARDVTKADRFVRLGVEVRQGDYADAASLPAAYEGADQLLLVSSNDPAADTVALHGDAIRAAASAGVGRILYTSHQAAAPDNPFHPGAVHFATEQLLAASGVPWTSLRNGFYAHSLQWLAGPWRETGTIAVPGDGPVSWTAREDVAEAAATILLSDRPFDGPTTLTAPAAPTFTELAATASEVAGRSVTFTPLTEDEWLAAQAAAGAPERMSGFLLGFYRAAQAGYFAGTDPLLGELLGRTPRTAEDALVSA